MKAQLTEIDLNKLIDQIKSEPAWENAGRNSVPFFTSDTMRISVMGLKESAELKPHKAAGVISVQVLEGKIYFSTDEQISLVETGQMITLEENVTHSVIALKESFFLLTIATKSSS